MVVQHHETGLTFHLFRYRQCDVDEEAEGEFAANSGYYKDENSKCKPFTISHVPKTFRRNCIMKSSAKQTQRH